MKQSLNLIAYCFLVILVCVSCKKDSHNSNRYGTPNNPPIANAGADITVYYDLQSCSQGQVNLDGRSSTDPDGKIMRYLWKGPGFISKPDSAVTSVHLLSTGQHQFILFVGDNKGNPDTDTMIVNLVLLMNRPTINAQLVPFATLSEAREGIAVGSAGNKILFAGASNNYNGQTNPSSRVDIYDIITNSWSTAELSVARQDVSVVTSGNKIFFAGGWNGNWEDPLMFTNLDIYDAASDSWTVKHLSEPRAWMGTASAGNKVFFAGGINHNTFLASSKVDIYDIQTDTWSASSLSEPRSNISTQVTGNKIHFAGGSNGSVYIPRPTIDVYDVITGLWSVNSMNEPKSNMKSFATGSKILWAGGVSINDWGRYNSAMVEIKDVNTQGSSFSCLHDPRKWLDNDQKAVIKNNQIIFFTGNGNGAPNKFDIYDIVNNSWSIGVLNQNIVGAAVIAVNNTIYVAGGYVNGSLSNVVWKLEF